MRGYWWSPDGDALLVARVDDAPVQRWHIADPANPDRDPDRRRLPGGRHPERPGHRRDHRARRHPDPGALGRRPRRVPRRRRVGRRTGCSIVVQPRDQRALRMLRGRPGDRRDDRSCTSTPTRTGSTSCPACRPAPPPARCVDRRRRRRRPPAAVDGEPVTPPSPAGARRARRRRRHGAARARAPTRRRSGCGRGAPTGWWSAPRSRGCTPAGSSAAPSWSPRRPSTPTAPSPPCTGSTHPGAARRRRRTGRAARAASPGHRCCAAVPSGRCRTALLLPSWHRPGTRLPVLMDPYGGPHAQRVLAARRRPPDQPVVRRAGLRRGRRRRAGHAGAGPGSSSAPCTATSPRRCWRTRSTPCTRSPRSTPISTWTRVGHPRLVVRRLPRRAGRAAPPGRVPRRGRRCARHRLDALRHPLHRALPGPPDANPDAYARSSLIPDAAKLTRPLLLVHGLADDNVVAAHTLRLSSALLAAGRPHSVLPLSGVTHMTPQEVVAENLLLLQVRVPQDALASPPARAESVGQRRALGSRCVRRRPRAARGATRGSPIAHATTSDRDGRRHPIATATATGKSIRRSRPAPRRTAPAGRRVPIAAPIRCPVCSAPPAEPAISTGHAAQGHRRVRRDHPAAADAARPAAAGATRQPADVGGASSSTTRGRRQPERPRAQARSRSARRPAARRRAGRRPPPTPPTPARTG